jgi:hypothetical protein
MADPAIHRIYHYSGCGTCLKALAWIRERRTPFEAIDITTSPPSLDLLSEAHRQLGGLGRLYQHQWPELSGPGGRLGEGDGHGHRPGGAGR